MRTLVVAACVLVVAGTRLDAQSGTDFSGTWVLEAGVEPLPPAPRRLVVQQPITTTTARGAPMSPAYLWLVVERQFADHTQRDSYNIGVIGGSVGGVTGNGLPAPQSRWAVGWEGSSLQMAWRNLAPSGETLNLRTEVWRLDQGRLVIVIETTERDVVATQTLSYRKED